MRAKLSLSLFIICFHSIESAKAQDAVPAEILGRTVAIQGPQQQGTAFAINYGGKVYEITAKHIMAGVSERNPTNVRIRRNDNWLQLPVTRVLYPASPDVDIAILETTITAEKEGFSFVGVSDKANMIFGQPVWFLGFPFLEGMGSKLNGSNAVSVPFIKKGILSAIDSSKPEAVVLYIDGFNNHGFSGGPIIYFDYTSRKYFIAGVVMGYRDDKAEVMVDGKHVPTEILVNSGILVGYSIDQVTETIKKSANK